MLSKSMGPRRPLPKLMFIAIFTLGLIIGYLYAFWEHQHAPWEWFGSLLRVALQTQMVPQLATMPHGAPPTLAAFPMSALLLALGVRLNRSLSITG